MNTTLSSLHLLNLLEYAACKGIDRQTLQNLLYTPESELWHEQGRVSIDEYCQVLDKMAVLSHDKHLGLHYGCFLNLKALGMIYQVSLATSSIEQAMGLLSEYLSNTFPLVYLLTGVSNDYFYIDIHSKLPDSPATRHTLDSVLFLMYREVGVMIEGNIAEVQLPHEQLDEYQRLCASPVTKAATHRIKLDYRQIAGAVNRRRLKNIETMLPVFLQLMSQPTQKNAPFSEQVRTMTLSLCTPELPQLDQVVAQFATSHRTFQRKLTEEGTSFRSIADAIKRQISAHLERGNTLGTGDIAYILGYSAPSAYLHAVRKWRNQSVHHQPIAPIQANNGF